MKTKVYDYTLYIKGLFGRNRKVKFQGFPLIENSENQFSADGLRALMEAKINSIKPRGQFILKVIETPCELEMMDGVQFKSHIIKFGTPPMIQEERSA